jgi:hypothetical protein
VLLGENLLEASAAQRSSHGDGGTGLGMDFTVLYARQATRGRVRFQGTRNPGRASDDKGEASQQGSVARLVGSDSRFA